MAYEFWISAHKLAWPMVCAKCMSSPDTHITIKTKRITARNLLEATWDIPYCAACQQADKSHPLRFGWFKSIFETFTERVHAIEYLKLHNSIHFFRFHNRDYLNLFLELNKGKRQSEILEK